MYKLFVFWFFIVFAHFGVSQDTTSSDSQDVSTEAVLETRRKFITTDELTSAMDLSDLERNNTKLLDAFIIHNGKPEQSDKETVKPNANVKFTGNDKHDQDVNKDDRSSDEIIVKDVSLKEHSAPISSGSQENSNEDNGASDEFEDKRLRGLISFSRMPNLFDQVETHRDLGFLPAPGIHNLLMPQHQTILNRNMLLNSHYNLLRSQIPPGPYGQLNSPYLSPYRRLSKSVSNTETRIEDYRDFSGNSYIYKANKDDMMTIAPKPQQYTEPNNNQQYNSNSNVFQKLVDASNKPTPTATSEPPMPFTDKPVNERQNWSPTILQYTDPTRYRNAQFGYKM